MKDSLAEGIKGLNSEQIDAIEKAYTCEDYLMIAGGPATGKKEIIARILLLANKMK